MAVRDRVRALYPSFEKRRIVGHPLTVYIIILAVFIFSTEQVRHVLDAGWPKGEKEAFLPALIVSVYTFLNFLVAILAAFLVVPRRPLQGSNRRALIDWLSRRIHGIRPLEWFSDLLIHAKRRIGTPFRQRGLALILFLLAIGWLMLPSSNGLPDLPIRMVHFVLLMGYVIWFLVPFPSEPSRLHKACGHFLLWVSAGLVMGGIIWYLPMWFSRVPFGVYTIWAIFFLLFLALATAQILDAIPGRGGSLVRIIAPVLFIGYLGLSSGVLIDPGKEDTTSDEVEDTNQWFGRMTERIQRMPPGPIILVAASGGGSRAAMFTAMVLEALANTDVDSSDGDTKHLFAENIALISGVSGGSLGSAYFMSRPERTKQPPRNYLPSQVAGRMRFLSRAYYEKYREKTKDDHSPENEDRLLAYWKAVQASEGLPETPPSIAPWLFASTFVDDMATDFMAPALRGVLTPILERGESTAAFWSRHFQWKDKKQRSPYPSTSPLAVFNVTDVDSGGRVLAGFPPPAPSLVVGYAERLALNLNLADAVRLSANFPWGFEIARLKRPAPNAKTTGELKLIDGGVLDNTGIDTLTYIIQRIEYFANDRNRSPFDDTEFTKILQDGAKTLRNSFLDRGVILIEIDSGSKPGESSFLASLLPGFVDPIKAINHAGHLTSERVKSDHLEDIENAFERMWEHPYLEDQLEISVDKKPDKFLPIQFVCNHSDDVMTAWALNLEDKAKIFTLFLMEAEERLPKLISSFQVMQQLNSEAQKVTDERQLTHQRQILEGLQYQQNHIALEEKRSALERRNLYKEFASQKLALQSTDPALEESSLPTLGPAQRVDFADQVGWVYLGHHTGEGWVTRYFGLPENRTLETLTAGDPLDILGSSNVRENLPGPLGQFENIMQVVRPGDEVILAGSPERWQNTGFYWAPVRYPER